MTTLILAALGLLVLYALACAVWPYRPCGGCGGTGKHRSPSGRAWRDCRRCHGSGKRLRIGRRLWTAGSDLGRRSR